MAATALTPIVPVGPHPAAVAPTDLDYAYEAVDDVNGNDFVGSGNDLLLLQNVGASPVTVTITSSQDPYKRTGNITDYSLGAGLFAAFKFSDLTGWADAAGKINITGSSTDLEVAVLRL